MRNVKSEVERYSAYAAAFFASASVMGMSGRVFGPATGDMAMQMTSTMLCAVLEAQKTIEAKDVEIERMRPKEAFADAVATIHTSILVGELAKLLKQNGVEIGQKRLFACLRGNSYLIKRLWSRLEYADAVKHGNGAV